MEILPAIDLRRDRSGRCRCVRLLQGRADAETEFSDDPAAVARRWQDCGQPPDDYYALDKALAKVYAVFGTYPADEVPPETGSPSASAPRINMDDGEL